jgi:hypothetical protein
MYGFSATATRENSNSLAEDRFIDERLEAGDLFGWYFLYQPIGRAPCPELMVTARQRLALHKSVVRARHQGKPIFLGDFWNDGCLTGGCIAAGRLYFHIYANGDISPCVFSPVSCGNVYDIFEGRVPYTSLAQFIEEAPLFRCYREAQKRIDDFRAPCILIDHPNLFSEVTRDSDWKPAKNFPEGYLSGSIREAIERTAKEWKQELAVHTESSYGDMQTFPVCKEGMR